jgi:diphosphomevalonate decarboxylase
MSFSATAEAPANLAFVKYWGKKDAHLRLPTNNSISVNLSHAKTITRVEFDEHLEQDRVYILGREAPPEVEFSERVFRHLDRVRAMAGVDHRAVVRTKNNFPTGVGIASSASGFAALTVASCAALGLDLTEKELSSLARLGSGSACRSIPDGFTEWIAEDVENCSYAVQVAPAEHWDIRIVTVMVSKQAKELSSTSGHSLATASPFFPARLESLEKRLEKVRSAILNRDLETFGRETEMEAISFHTIAMTSPILSATGWQSGAYYWLPDSLELMLAVQYWRRDGIEVYFTLDAGPTVHLICLNKELSRVVSEVHETESRIVGRKWDILVNSPSEGTHLVEGKNLAASQ